MKMTMALLVLLTSTLSWASTTALTKDDTGLYPASVSIARVYFTTPDCPINAMCAPMVYADVGVRLSGCLDRVGTVSSSVEQSENGQNAKLNISVIAIKNKKSASVKCVVAPTKVVKVLITGGTSAVPEVELNDLNRDGQ